MPRRPYIGILRLGKRKTDSVPDLAGYDFVIPDQARKYGQTSSIGRGPRGRPQSLRQQVKDGPRTALPARRLRKGIVDLIKDAVIGINRNDVAISRAGTTAFDGGGEWDGVRARVAFTLIGKGGRIFGLRSWNRYIRDTDRKS